MAKDLPMWAVSIDENVVRIGMEKVAGARFDPALLRKLPQIESKMKR